jgi:nanoRNase/pAp phosphatase (c-di-AMP/oligoRNAs hydrolase)
VNRSVAAGLCDHKLVVIFRAGGLRQDMGRLAQAAFKALGSAGGHKNMARAEIPLANLEPKLLAQPAGLSRFILRRLALARAEPWTRVDGQRDDAGLTGRNQKFII